MAVQIARALPGAIVRLTRTPDELERWLASLVNPQCILAAGGDGTVMALVNALHKVTPKDAPLPPIGILPLGTGNAWAHSAGARKLGDCVEALRKPHNALPMRRYGLIDIEDQVTFLAGCGWDSEILEDYRRSIAHTPAARLSKNVWTYLSAAVTRTAPRSILLGRARVTVENLGETVYAMQASGEVERLRVGPGKILYEGFASVAGAATVPEFGYGFRAYPFAERMPGLINIRVYDEKPIRALAKLPLLWQGAHPLKGAHDWFVDAVRMTFSREVPLQIAGDAIGMRQVIEYRTSARSVTMLDWRRML